MMRDGRLVGLECDGADIHILTEAMGNEGVGGAGHGIGGVWSGRGGSASSEDRGRLALEARTLQLDNGRL